MPDKILPKFVAYYQQDFAASARMNRNLDWLQRHVYRTLCLEAPFCETRPCLPADDTQLALLADVPDEVWTENREPVLKMFIKTDEGYSHPRILKEYEKACDKYEQRREAGRLGGLSRAKNQADAKGSLSETQANVAEQEQDREQEQDVEATPTPVVVVVQRPDASLVETQPQNQSGLIAGYSEEVIREHYDKLLASGQPWVCGEGRDGIKRMRRGWVEHVMSLEPPKTKTPPAGGYRPAQVCKCGRPKPCELHDLKLKTPEPEPCYLCNKCPENRKKACAWHKRFLEDIKICPNCKKLDNGKIKTCDPHSRENQQHEKGII